METSQTLRQVRMVGRFGWYGGYTHALLMDDGEIIGPECVKPNYRNLSASTREHAGDGWEVIAVIALDGSDEPDYCAHCYKELF